MTSLKVEGEEIVEGQNSKEASITEYIKRVEHLASSGGILCEDVSLSAAPGAPTSETVYLVAATPAGGDAWEGETDNLAFYFNGGWIFVPPGEGWIVYDRTGGWRYEFDGANWLPHKARGRWSFGFKGETAPAVDDILMRMATDTKIEIPATSNYGGPAPETNPGTQSVIADLIDVTAGGSTVLGTVTLTTAGSNSFAIAGGTAKQVEKDRMLIVKVTQADDGTIAGFAGTFTAFEVP